MHIPTQMPSVPMKSEFAVASPRTNQPRNSMGAEIEPAGCCVQVCTPFGCHCVLDLPICP
jgi:hypothetical protein